MKKSPMIDKDLLFLEDCTNEQLKSLVDILVFDKDGKKRYSESLSNTRAFNECYPNNLKPLIPAISNEIQLFGGNSILNFFRQHGVSYREILEDVCDRLKVNYNKKLSTELIEAELLRKVAVTVVEKMSEEDIKAFDANLDKTRLMDAVLNDRGGSVLAISAIVVSQFTKQIGTQVVKLFGKALATRLTAFAVPIINVLAIVWTAFDIASPAYRVTTPFTLTVAFIRKQMKTSPENLNLIFA